MLRNNILNILSFTLLFAASITANAELTSATLLNVGDEPEGITYSNETKNYTIVYETVDVNGLPMLFKTEYIPPTKIRPKAFTRLLDVDNLVRYRLRFLSKVKSNVEPASLQDIVNAEIELTDSKIVPDTIKSPDGWQALYDETFTNTLAWFFTSPVSGLSIKPGVKLRGFNFKSRKLPGVVKVKFRGKAPVLGLSGEGPEGEDGEKLKDLLNNNYVAAFTSGPVINNPEPFNAVAVLESMKLHFNDLHALNYLSESLIINTTQLIDLIVDAINMGNKIAAVELLDKLAELVGVIAKEDRVGNSLDITGILPKINRAFRRACTFNIDYIKQRL